MHIEIADWDQFNPRKDYIKSMPWFRVKSDIAFSESLFGLSPDQKWLWIILLSHAARRISGDYNIDLPYLSFAGGMSDSKTISTILEFEERGLLKVNNINESPDPIGSVRIRVPDKKREDKIREDNVEQVSTVPFFDVVDYLNEKTSRSFKATTKTTQRLIKARFADKFSLEDFKIVIDHKTREWIHDAKMNEFLRPETLFGTKFEGYLEAAKAQGTPGVDPLKEFFDQSTGESDE